MFFKNQKSCRKNLSGFAVFITLLITLFLANPAQAATIAVTTTTDELDSTATSAGCSLREAIQNINDAALTYTECSNVGGGFGVSDTITVPAGTCTLIGGPTENANLSGDFDITKPLTITGAGQATTIIQAGTVGPPTPNASSRVFHVPVNVPVTFGGVTIRNGYDDLGAGVRSAGAVTLTNSTVSGNTAFNAGGGIFADGALTLTNSTVSGNAADSDGGGIYSAGQITMTSSTVSGNTATLGSHAGIMAQGALILTNSTVSGNSAGSGRGGGIGAFSAVTLTNSTIYGNNAGRGGGGVFGDDIRGTVSVTTSNSIIANNTGGDCFKTGGTFTSIGYNIDSDNTCNLVGIGDQPNTTVATLNLGALANNGGPTMTHELLVGSPAVDAGTCVNATDQRGIGRPLGGGCDIGAYEAELFLLTVTVSGAGSVTDGTGINCPAAICAKYQVAGTVVTLTAIASSGETFTGWGGACAVAGTATTCTVTMSAVKTVSASFGGYGCTDPAALNYNSNATIDDGSCVYTALIPGCTDPAATNYHPAATQDDGSCTYSSDGGGASSGSGNQPPTAGRHGDKWLHYPDNGDSVGPDTKFVWDELIDPDGDTVFYDLYICLNGDFTNCTPIPVTPSYRTVAAVGFGMTGALFIGFCFVGGVRSFRGRALLTAALLVACLTLSHCGSSSSSDESTTNGDRFSCDGEDGYSVCYDSKGLAAGDYQWRVTASDGKGATNTSETRSFTVE